MFLRQLIAHDFGIFDGTRVMGSRSVLSAESGRTLGSLALAAMREFYTTASRRELRRPASVRGNLLITRLSLRRCVILRSLPRPPILLQ